MQISPWIHIIEAVIAPAGGWPYERPSPKYTTAHFYHSRYNLYRPALVIDKKGLILIDGGTTGSFPQIKAGVEGLGYVLRDIKSIIVSHGHVDHVGCLKELVDATGAKVYAHEAEVSYLLKKLPQPCDARYFEAVNIDVHLRDGDVLDILGGLEIIHAPGHTPGHIVLYAPKHKVLFGGDIARCWKGELHMCTPQFSVDYVSHIKSMLKVAKYDFQAFIPYHCDYPLTEHACEKFRDLIDYMKSTSDIFLPEVKAALAPEIEG